MTQYDQAKLLAKARRDLLDRGSLYRLYQFGMSEEELEAFRTEAIEKIKLEDERPHIERLEGAYLNLIEEAYYDRREVGREK